MGGKRKSGVANPRSRDVDDNADTGGEDRPGALLCDLFRLTRGRLGVVRSGEEVDRTMGGGLSPVTSVGDAAGISMLGTPRVDRTSR